MGKEGYSPTPKDRLVYENAPIIRTADEVLRQGRFTRDQLSNQGAYDEFTRTVQRELDEGSKRRR